ncbi:Calcium-binding atopy-related autoantigen [Phytophthora megakarya]|uniref:Calcium-binding atopy-related autoantigen n=1 Tax=Phytophthora megakarya TaxID=4795 RepID=A0A225VZC0_9STRA|nr:Calcium-binding atopy-related autoantigen [Phytophthora megakarya]
MSRLLLRSLRSPSAVAAFAVASSFSAVSFHPSARLEATPFDKPTFTERTVGNYENRIRKFSSPERVFEYFSSVEIDKHFYMTRDDLARAVTPYTYRHGAPIASKNPKFNAKAKSDKNPKEVADEYLRRVQTLMIDNANVSKDDVKALLTFRDEHHVDFETHVKTLRQHVDFETHVKTLRVLQITNAEFDQFVVMHGGPQRPKTFFDMVDADVPERQFELAFKMFDTDDNGKLDHREFKQIMELMRLRTPAGRQDRSLHDDDVPIFKHLFGELATESLSYDDFCKFRRDLKQEIMRIQISFSLYDVDGDNTLSPREFGMFLVSHVDQRHIEMWVDRVDKLQGHITEQEFMDFNVFLEHLDELNVAMDLVMQAHGVDKEQFQRATKAAVRGSKNTKPVTPLQIDILFALFDLDGDGHLSTKEFIEVMQTRKDSGFNEPRDTGALNFVKRIKECICVL